MSADPQPEGTPPPPPAPYKNRPRKEGDPGYRALRVYAFDPSRGRRLGNHMTVRIRYEAMEQDPDSPTKVANPMPGICGDQVVVIDYDATNGLYYEPVDLNSRAALVEGGLEPSEADPRFHQQMVYAVAMRTISTFERALGRDIRYHFADAGIARSHLRIFPHAMYEPNAYYSRELGALLFGYFKASAEEAGSNLPGGTIFTCLSHDIIAHETSHSIIDTLRQPFMESTNPDVPAFHEAFADIVALFLHFKFEEVVRDTLQRTGGALHRFNVAPRGAANAEGEETDDGKRQVFLVGEMTEGNPLLDLAKQFGESMGRRAALRSALGVPPDPHALDNATEAHERGAVLVAAVFDAFFSSFIRRTADLIRLARTAAGGSDEIHPDIAARLAAEAAKTASHFCTMCIRAIDYCPPVDIKFGEFLRALITADTELYQSDAHDYRDALIQAFRARGIYPEGVSSLSEESLMWNPAPPGTPACGDLKYDLIDPFRHAEENRQALEKVVRESPYCFGLCKVAEHECEKCDCKVDSKDDVVQSVNMVIRAGDQRPQVEFVAVIVGYASAEDPDRPNAMFSGGSTVVFDSAGNAKLSIYKKLSSAGRRKEQAEFAARSLAASPFAAYVEPEKVTGVRLSPLSGIHRGY